LVREGEGRWWGKESRIKELSYDETL